jgi:hypothetical protein
VDRNEAVVTIAVMMDDKDEVQGLDRDGDVIMNDAEGEADADASMESHKGFFDEDVIMIDEQDAFLVDEDGDVIMD